MLVFLKNKQRKSVPISAEILDEVSDQRLLVSGEIPTWLSGTLVRNGPIKVTVNGQCNEHWFDGLAMLHGFSFDKGQVVYTNKFLRSDAFRAVFEEGSLHYVGFAVDPCRSLFKSFFTLFSTHEPTIQNANVNVTKLAEAYVAMTVVPLPVQFDPQTLETLGVFDYQDQLPTEKYRSSYVMV